MKKEHSETTSECINDN